MSDVASHINRAPVPKFVTVTLTYSLSEDRIRLDGLDSAGETLTLWLTARLLNRLVPYLIRRQFDRRASVPDSSEPAAYAGEDADTGADAVRCKPNSPEVLVASIDISSHAHNLLLVFKDREHTQRAVFSLPDETLWHWNLGLKQCFEQAGWSQEAFKQRALAGRLGVITIH